MGEKSTSGWRLGLLALALAVAALTISLSGLYLTASQKTVTATSTATSTVTVTETRTVVSTDTGRSIDLDLTLVQYINIRTPSIDTIVDLAAHEFPVVAIGQVRQVEQLLDDYWPIPNFTAQYRVLRRVTLDVETQNVLKGPVNVRTLVFMAEGGRVGSFVHEVKPWLDFAVGERVLVILWQEPYTPEGSRKRKGYYLASPAMTFALKDGLAVNKLSGESISEVLFVDMLRKAITEVAQGP